MKKNIKELMPAILLGLVVSFMLIIYEPIIMYSNNISDFWFDIYEMFSCNLIAFVYCFLIIITIYLLVYLIGKYVFKSEKIYYICLLIGFAGFIVTYIQGNYLASSLPVLDGNEIVWGNYKMQMIVSAVLLITITTAVIICVIKFKFIKVINVLKYITIAILIMLVVSLISTLLTTNCFMRKDYSYIPTTDNINKYSENKNFIILLMDNMDSEFTNDFLKNNDKYKKVIEDFNYYPDTVGGYIFTRDSIPLILTGKWNENQTSYEEFYRNAMKDSELLKYLDEKKYEVNIYDGDIICDQSNISQIKNLSSSISVNKKNFVKQEAKYILFKYLPFYLKQYSKIETMDYNEARINDDTTEKFTWDNESFYYNDLQKTVDYDSKNQFKFIHLEGAHPPFDCDENLQSIDNTGTYEQKTEASFELIEKYINYLKENNVYDNSVIIIMADHGYEYKNEDIKYRHNPIFFVKGINEKNSNNIMDEKISYNNLIEMFKNLLDEGKTENMLDNIEANEYRRVLVQAVWDYDHMTEYVQEGNAREEETYRETGNVYNIEN